ncbi:MAG: hypothetical protein KTR18_03705 [Acidiferrobacterales bacterium]|nr:hypothetical protein [Acidiferrobacterales bacterium]
MLKNISETISIEGSYSLTTDSSATWKNLIDPEVLGFCIRGCDEVVRLGDGKYSACFTFGIGPFKKTVSADLQIHEIDPPDSYQLQASLETKKWGKAGGIAKVTLVDTDIGCDLCYQADIRVSGWFDTFSASVIRRAANKALDSFFERFKTICN